MALAAIQAQLITMNQTINQTQEAINLTRERLDKVKTRPENYNEREEECDLNHDEREEECSPLTQYQRRMSKILMFNI